MITNQEFKSVSYYWSLTIPAGAQVIFVPGDGGGYAIKNPKLYGLNDHDATYRYVWVPENIIDKES